MRENEQKALNPFGDALAEVMAEKGVSGVPELVERMRQHPSWSEQFTEEYITNLVTMTDADEWPEDDVDMVLFHVLKQEEVLSLSNDELITKLMDPFYWVAGPILDQQHQRRLSEREEWIEYLSDPSPAMPALSREDPELRMVDDDLWVLYPECRYEFPVGEESVRQWRDAVSALEGLSIAVENLGDDALQHAIGDAHVRAMEAPSGGIASVPRRPQRSNDLAMFVRAGVLTLIVGAPALLFADIYVIVLSLGPGFHRSK